jgi:hypothetical protein
MVLIEEDVVAVQRLMSIELVPHLVWAMSTDSTKSADLRRVLSELHFKLLETTYTRAETLFHSF